MHFFCRHPRSHPVLSQLRTVATSTLFCLVLATSAQAQLVCGDAVEPGSKVVLTADVDGCTGAGVAALTITGPATVDLNGFQVRCSVIDPADGIAILGVGVRLSNGSVRGCNAFGVSLGGSGRHTLTDFAVKASSGDGVLVASDSNTLRGVAATNGNASGFNFTGSANRVSECTATNNNDQGFVVAGDATKLSSNAAVNNQKEGFLVGGNGNRLKANTATTSGREGFELAGNDNRLKRSIAIRNTQEGVVVAGNDNRVDRVVAIHNAGHGFSVSAGSGSRLKRCSTTSNGGAGFDLAAGPTSIRGGRSMNNATNGLRASGGFDNRIEDVVSLESGTNDVSDSNACGDTRWRNNTFRTSNDLCIE
ncbi:MAG: parallel beta-helix repeat protein [Hyphomicrobiaceae bacterium]|jgi:parallel beta-helix repeat protein